MGKHLVQALPFVYALQCLTGKRDKNKNNNITITKSTFLHIISHNFTKYMIKLCTRQGGASTMHLILTLMSPTKVREKTSQTFLQFFVISIFWYDRKNLVHSPCTNKNCMKNVCNSSLLCTFSLVVSYLVALLRNLLVDNYN